MSKIKEIHESHLYGSVIETGSSTATIHKLLDVAGASKTIFRAEQPYSKLYEEELYGEFPRSVSKEFIEAVLNVEGERKNINFVLASSWQLNNENPNGWFGLYDKINNVKHYLHYSFQPNAGYKRLSLIDSIGEIGICILHSAISGNINEIDTYTSAIAGVNVTKAKEPHNANTTNYLNLTTTGTIPTYTYTVSASNADLPCAILDQAYLNNEVNYDLLISQLEKSKDDYFLVFENNKPIRFVDLMRRSEIHIISKGSYNPLHTGHLTIMNKSLEKYPNSAASFLISTFRYDKPHITTEEIKDRIKSINHYNHPLIVCKSFSFYETFNLLNKWSLNKEFLMPIGTDTINRIYTTDYDYIKGGYLHYCNNSEIKLFIEDYIEKRFKANKNCKFLLYNRLNYNRLEETNLYNEHIECIDYEDDGISSSAIREGKMVNNLR